MSLTIEAERALDRLVASNPPAQKILGRRLMR